MATTQVQVQAAVADPFASLSQPLPETHHSPRKNLFHTELSAPGATAATASTNVPADGDGAAPALGGAGGAGEEGLASVTGGKGVGNGVGGESGGPIAMAELPGNYVQC